MTLNHKQIVDKLEKINSNVLELTDLIPDDIIYRNILFKIAKLSMSQLKLCMIVREVLLEEKPEGSFEL
jgi:hypothetical protein